MLGLVLRRFSEDVLNLNVAVLFRLRCVIQVFRMGLRLPRKRSHQILLGLSSLEVIMLPLSSGCPEYVAVPARQNIALPQRRHGRSPPFATNIPFSIDPLGANGRQTEKRYIKHASQAKGRGSQNRSQTKDEKHQRVEALPQETNAGVKPSIRRLQREKSLFGKRRQNRIELLARHAISSCGKLGGVKRAMNLSR